jgi:type I restriction enzyme, S subunit
MEVTKDAYKDTKVGSIPKDWDIIKLGETCEFYRGQPFAKSEIIEDGVRECVHYGQLFTIYSEIIEKVYSKTNADLIRASEYGDILMPSSDVTPIGLATASVINKKGVLIGGDVNIIRPIIKLNSTFLSYLINYEKKKIIRLISGTNVKHLYNRNIKTLQYVSPPLAEQQKIADILSEADAKIEKEQTQKSQLEALKKGLMQQLLTGKKRVTV